MQDQTLASESKPLSQIDRVVDTFVAPSKTFTDILRSTSWWLPFLLAVIATVASNFAVDKKIGFERIVEQVMQQTPSTAENFSQLSPEQRARQLHSMAIGYRLSSYASSVYILAITAFGALVNWASFNFGLGAKTTYSQNFAVWMYASLPQLFFNLLNVVFIYAGVNTESFNIKNPVGTNIGFYMMNSAPWLKTAMSFFDIFGLWTLALMIVGTAVISHKTKGQAAAIVVGWWGIIFLATVGCTAAFS